MIKLPPNTFVRLLTIFLLWTLVAAEPVQYCRFGDASHPDASADFCVGITMHQNASTSSNDLMLTITHTRYKGSNRGWTAVGVGDMMKGSLMFILYGDPASAEDPIVSVRRATGHHQPILITQADMNGADLRVLSSTWIRTSPPSASAVAHSSFTAKVNLVCYSCHLWPGTEISATTDSQPWIWAWNAEQDFAVYAFDAHLDMHTHHLQSGGFGKFYIDMQRSHNTGRLASFPPIKASISTINIFSSYISFLAKPTLHLHALFMVTAFFLVFPAGAIAMRLGSPSAFKYHWIAQLLGCSMILQGAVIGLFMRPRIDTVHQGVGITLVCAIGVQIILGWRHHVRFLEERHRSWLSYAHMRLGKILLFIGLGNTVTGMMLYGWPAYAIIVVSILGSCELLAILLWFWYKSRRVREDYVAQTSIDLPDEK